ncbi:MULTISPECIES: hypothetical protein [Erwinia]|uniref:hypothetical protein n=1 Tax=Erwinia TaxID=551 RepID=UPI000557F377|nr:MULTISPECIES: hypothetical protein [Erwinia]
MRELTVKEIHQTSGGIFGIITAPIGAFIGFVVGELVDEALAMFGNFETNFRGAGMSLGAGIAALIGLSPIMTLVFMREGILGMVQNGLDIAQQARDRRQPSA